MIFDWFYAFFDFVWYLQMFFVSLKFGKALGTHLGHPWEAASAPSGHLGGTTGQVKIDNGNIWCAMVMWFQKQFA